MVRGPRDENVLSTGFRSPFLPCNVNQRRRIPRRIYICPYSPYCHLGRKGGNPKAGRVCLRGERYRCVTCLIQKRRNHRAGCDARCRGRLSFSGAEVVTAVAHGDRSSCQQTCVFRFKLVFLRGKENVPTIKQNKKRGNASNLVQSHFGSPGIFFQVAPDFFDQHVSEVIWPSPGTLTGHSVLVIRE